MPSEKGKFVRFCVDFTEQEYLRLRLKAEAKGCTKARIVRRGTNRETKDVEIPTREARQDLYKAQ